MSRPSTSGSKDAPALKRMRIDGEDVNLDIPIPTDQIPFESITDNKIPLPAKQEAKSRLSAKLIYNALTISPSGPKKPVYKYDFKIEYYRTRPTDDDPHYREFKELNAGPKNDIAKMNRRRHAFNIFLHVIKHHPMFKLHKEVDFIFDQARTMYSVHKLLEKKTKETFEYKNDAIFDSAEVVEFIGRAEGYRVTVEFVEDIAFSLDNMQPYNQFMDILTSQNFFHDNALRDEFWCFPNGKFFYNRNAQDVNIQRDGRVLRYGLEKGVRPVGKSAQYIVQYETKLSPFFPELRLEEFLVKMWGNGWSSPNRHADINKLLKNLVVKQTHVAHPKYHMIHEVDFKNALENTRFVKHDRQTGTRTEMTVYDYYRRELPHVRVQRNEAVVHVKVGKDMHYYPISTLKIVAGQRVSLKKQQIKNMSQDMTRNCQQLPPAMKEKFLEIVEKGAYHNGHRWVANFGMRFALEAPREGQKPKKEGMDVDGIILHKPVLAFGRNATDSMQPDSSWKMSGKTFIKPVTGVRWALGGDVGTSSLEHFAKDYVSIAARFGLMMEKPRIVEEFHKTHDKAIRLLQDLKKDKFVLFFFITRDKLDIAHEVYKYAETNTIVTQHICRESMDKILGKSGAQTQENVVCKTNLKLGGLNYSVSVNPQNLNLRTGHRDVKTWLTAGRMFVGIELSHASVAERMNSLNPTVVGMAFNVNDEFLNYGRYFYQCARQGIVFERLIFNNFYRAIETYRQKSGSYPKEVFVYRSGVSEGEYQYARHFEVKNIRRAMNQHKMDTVPLIYIVAQKMNKSRILRANITGSRAMDMNIGAGTVLEKGVSHPLYNEFICASHRCIQGTTKPVRYTVLCNGFKPNDSTPHVSLDALFNITHMLSFHHAIVASPVSVPAVLYSAKNLAKRGNANFKEYRNHRPDDAVPLVEYNTQDKDRPEYKEGQSDELTEKERILSERFENELSVTLAPKLHGKFWA